MKQIKLKITQELSTYVQSIYYEIQMRQEIVQKLIIDASSQSIPLSQMTALKEYEQEIIERKVKLDTILNEIKHGILPMFEDKNVVFTVNFQDVCLDISLNDDEAIAIYEDNKEHFQGVKSCTLK